MIEELIEPSKYIAVALAVQVGLRGAAEVLTRVSVVTENKWDNKAAEYIGNAAWFLGTFLGYFGVGVAKEIKIDIQEKAQADLIASVAAPK